MVTAAFVSRPSGEAEKPLKITPRPASDFIVVTQFISVGVWLFFFPPMEKYALWR